jgi:16S rRNA (guanine527-N7)-methyltransferase
MSERRHELEQGAKALGVPLTSAMIDAMVQYLDLLEETNKTMNLTRIPPEEQVSLHLIDSLTCVPLLQVLDIGTGAGFPGVPIAVARPEASVVLLDSTLKKLRFIEESAKTCGVRNVSVVHARAELLAQDPSHRERYDVVVSRAVAAYDELVQLMLPFVKPGGIAIAMKGAGYEDEMLACTFDLDELGGEVEQVHHVALPGTTIERHLIVVRKDRSVQVGRKTLGKKRRK